MKTLYLLRHAKSSWDDPELKDFERPLNARGIKDVSVMAERFKAGHKTLSCIICSPAVRAKTTAQLLAEHLNFPVSDVISNPELYFAGTGMLLKAVSQIDEACESAMLVGHNPAITEFANVMAGTEIDNIPTCGVVELSLNCENWSEVELGQGTLLEFDFPKSQKTTD